MRSDLGRFYEGRLLGTIKLLKTVEDLASGLGSDVSTWIDGRELVFGRSASGRGFLRVIPAESAITLAFPRGHDLLDPKKRARGAPGSETRLLVRDALDLDLYVRRMIHAAYALEPSPVPEAPPPPAHPEYHE